MLRPLLQCSSCATDGTPPTSCHLFRCSIVFSAEQCRCFVLMSPGGMWTGWRLKERGGRRASGSLLTVAGGLSPLMGYWPPLGRGHEVTIHHSHIHMSSDSYVPLPCDHTGSLDITTRGTHWHGKLVFPFLLVFFSTFLLFPFPEPIPFPFCLLLPAVIHNLNSVCTLF